MLSNDRGLLYPTVQAVLIFHAHIFGISVEQARLRLHFPDKLDSALARPRWVRHMGDGDLVQQAAYLVHGVAEAQAFEDGNKRTAVLTLESFLRMNGYDLTLSNDSILSLLIRISGGLSVESVSDELRRHIVRAPETSPFWG